MTSSRPARAELTVASLAATAGLTRAAIASASASVTVRMESGCRWACASAGNIRVAVMHARSLKKGGTKMLIGAELYDLRPTR